MHRGPLRRLFDRLTLRLRSSRRWPWVVVFLAVLLSEAVTLVMNCINSLLWYGRVDPDLLAIGTIDAFVASGFVAPLAIFLIRHAFNLEDVNRKLQEQMNERLRAEEERRILEERLQQARKMEAVGLLAGGVAHDLNNILGALVGYPDLLLMQLPAESPQRHPLLTIKESGQRAAAVVQDLLTLARRGVRTESVLNLNHVARDYLQSLEFTKLAALHPRVAVDARLAADLLNIRGSGPHLGKALMNLVTNACEAVDGTGQVHIVTENVHLDTPVCAQEEIPAGDYVLLRVSDTGAGILPEDRERIFEPFYTKKVMGRSGTGLGLAVVWGTIKDHSGFVAVHSPAGQGSCFSVYLPIVPEDLESVDPAGADGWRGQGEGILVVDDDQQQRELAQRILTHLGYCVETAGSGSEAVARLRTKRADLVVLDMLMEPGWDGLETYLQILKLHPGQKALIASGFSETARVEKALALGAGAYLRKPYSVAGLGQAVRRELNRSAAGG